MSSPRTIADARDANAYPVSPADRAAHPYRLLARIGQGGMSEIFLAEWEPAPGVHRLVVVKRLLDHINEDVGAVQMFLDEARVALRLSHPNIVQTHDVGLSEGRYCIAMEYLRGQPLHRVTQRVQASKQRLPLEAAAGIAIDILEGLVYAHDAVDYDGTPLAVVHRDVSPQNIFVQYDGRVKLLDFGIAKASTQEGRTRTGLVKGKFGYMAPEQALAVPVDRRADIWSVGVVLWELLAGLRLFKGNSEAATLTMTLTAQIPPVETFRPEVPEALAAVVRRALTRELEHRYVSALSMKEDLERWLESAGVDTSARNLAPLMTELFDNERKAQERAVRELVSRPDAAPSSQRTGFSATPFTSVASVPRAEASVTVLVDELRRKDRLLARTFFTMIGFVVALAAGLAFALLRSGGTAASMTEKPWPVAAAPMTIPADVPSTPRPTPSMAAAPPPTAIEQVPPPPVATPSVAAPQGRRHFAPEKRRAGAPSKPASVTPTEGGFLTLDTTPWSVVSVGGRVLGQTPIVSAALPAGEHAVELSNPELELRTKYFVRIEPGRTTVRRVGLE